MKNKEFWKTVIQIIVTSLPPAPPRKEGSLERGKREERTAGVAPLIVSDGNFATAVTTVVAIVVYDAELAGGHTVDGGGGMYHIAAVAHSF